VAKKKVDPKPPAPPHKNPSVTVRVLPLSDPYPEPRAVDPDQGSGEQGFYFNLACGHVSPCRTRVVWGRPVPSPARAEWRPCEECKAKLIAEGRPIPPCPMCRGAGKILNGQHKFSGGHEVRSYSVSRCRACHGKTTNPDGTPEPDLRGVIL